MNIPLPPFYLITIDCTGNINHYLSALENSLLQGAQLVQFRSKNLDAENYLFLAEQVTDLVHKYGGKIVLNGSPNLLDKVNADGIHFTSAAIAEHTSRPLPENYLVSVACHNEEQIQQANLVKPNFAVLCPVFATPSSPKGIPLGWDKFKAVVSKAKFPVYALGGLEPKDYSIARENGAYGLAAKRALWDLEKPLAAFESTAEHSE